MTFSHHVVTIEEALSGIFGSISLTAWICLLIPQLITNYKTKSADGLSMLFLAVWLFGDIANLSGALVTGLAPTAVTLAVYFCISDVILIAQCVYYNTLNARKTQRQHTEVTGSAAAAAATTTTNGSAVVEGEGEDEGEQAPLLRRRRSSAGGLPGSHRRHSARLGHEESGLDSLKRVVTGEDETPDQNPWLHNALGLVAVWIIGALGWFISYRAGAWDGPDTPDAPNTDSPVAVVGMVLGYASALCYLCARIPQIIKNYQEKSCEGLALLFFLLSLTGNLTYGLSVISYSQERGYIIKAVPWLLGSLGTIVEDFIIFYQFRIYAVKREPSATTGETAAVVDGANSAAA